MAVQAGEAYIPVRADMSDFGKQVETGTTQAGGKIKGFAKTTGGLLAGAFAIDAAKDFFGASVAGARESAAIANQTAQAIKSTGGVANVTADEVGELSARLSEQTAIDDELIQSGANLMLTFRNVRNTVGEGNDIFDQSVGIANDLAVALGTDMKSATLQVGKALNDPIKGVSALGRAGVQFTDAQKEQIEAMVESGNVMGAQKIIMKELETQVGGSAAAQADGAKKLGVAWGNFQETIGGLLIPVLDDLLGILTPIAQWASEHPGVIMAVAAVVGGALVAAFIAWAASAAAAAAATIAAAAPVIAITAMIAALVAGLIWAYQNWDWFKAVVDGVVGFFKNTLIPAIGDVIGWIGDIATKIAEVAISVGEKVGDIVGFFTGLPGRLADAAGDVFGFLWDSFKGVINTIIRAWNGLEFKLPDIDWNPPGPGSIKVKGPTLGFPNIPELATGGSAVRAGLALVGEEGPELLHLPRGASVIPLDREAKSSEPVELHFHQSGHDPGAVLNTFAWALAGRR